MNLKTTLALVVLAACVAGLAYTLVPWRDTQPVSAQADPSRQVLASLTPDGLKRIEVRRGKEVTTLTRARDGSWVMPGNWPTRPAEVRGVVGLLSDLRSRFEPIPLDDDEAVKAYGMDAPPITVAVETSAGGKHTLAFVEKDVEGDSARFDWPTFVRVDDASEVLRLGPGLMRTLDRPADFYLQRRLFPVERVPREEGLPGRVERLAARRLVADEPGKRRFALEKTKDGWELAEPYRDALDPATRDRLLEAVAELWAERFLSDEKAKDLDGLGLKSPERILSVTRSDGGRLRLLIGKPVFGAGIKDRAYARLEGFQRVFEINADKLNGVFVGLDTLRDSRLARFSASDAREVRITTSKGTVLLRNQAAPRAAPDPMTPPPPGDWHIVEPISATADASVVDRLLSSLSGANALDKDLREKAQLAGVVAALTRPAGSVLSVLAPAALVDPAHVFGLDHPAATIAVTVEEGKREAQKTKKTFTVRIGRHDKAAKKLYARSQGWPRIDEIDDSLAELVLDKSALDYRGKRVLDFSSADVNRLEVRRLDLPALGAGVVGLMATPLSPARLGSAAALAGDRTTGVALQRGSEGWNLTAPVKTEADTTKALDLADRLGKLEALAWVAGSASPGELQKKYGLGVPALSITVRFSGAKKPARTLHVGNARPREPGYYARLEGAPEVFAIAADVRDLLDHDALFYRPGALWHLTGADEVTRLKIAKAGQDEYQLTRKGDGWQVSGPFTVSAPREVVDKLVGALVAPRAEEYRLHSASDYRPFGLASPAVKVTLTTKAGKNHTLWIGDQTESGPRGRFARQGTAGGAVFVVSDTLARTVDQSALDFLDRHLLKFDPAAAVSFTRQRGGDVLELVKKDDAWRLTRPADLPADEKKVPELLKLLGELKAERIAAYKPKDVKPYGLDKPEATVTVKLSGDAKPAEHILEIGSAVKTPPGARYARVKGSSAVAELSASVVDRLLAGPLAYRDHFLARLPDADSIKLEMGQRRATFAKPEGTWKMIQPISTDADHDALESLFNSLARLRADELVAEKPSPQQLKTFGLDKPGARWQFLTGDLIKLDILVGATEKAGPRRYARLEGNDLVFLLDAKLSAALVAEYRPRTVFKESIDPAQIEAVRFGYRKGAFELKKVDGTWQVEGKPEAKVNDKVLTDSLAALRDLKLEHYVKDSGAQLKLYGLDPPELVLEVTTPSGKHTLHLGGLEGGTKKRYARLPVAGRADVFVLDETASGKLFQNLGALASR